MTIQTVNVIEFDNESIVKLQCFPANKYCIPEAESLFRQLALEHGASPEAIEAHVEDGTFERGAYKVNLVHSVC